MRAIMRDGVSAQQTLGLIPSIVPEGKHSIPIHLMNFIPYQERTLDTTFTSHSTVDVYFNRPKKKLTIKCNRHPYRNRVLQQGWNEVKGYADTVYLSKVSLQDAWVGDTPMPRVQGVLSGVNLDKLIEQTDAEQLVLNDYVRVRIFPEYNQGSICYFKGFKTHRNIPFSVRLSYQPGIFIEINYLGEFYIILPRAEYDAHIRNAFYQKQLNHLVTEVPL